MELFGYSLTRKAAPPVSALTRPHAWFPIVRESYPGAWQQNVEVSLVDVLTHPTVYACVSLIASDIAKTPPRLVQRDVHGIWTETESAAFSPVLRKPNHFQTRIAFYKSWLISKLTRGNTYVLKQRDQRQIVTALYVLDPTRVIPLVAPDGAVYYEIRRDDLSGQSQESVVVPASEIIHDTMNTLYHPLVGIGPLHACGLVAMLGLKLQSSAAKFFANGSQPSGILTAPVEIKQEQATEMKTRWEAEFSGDNVGKVAVVGYGLKYEPLRQTAVDAQQTEQWKAVDEAICGAFHMPPYLVAVGPMPTYNNIEALMQAYHSQCLQEHFEAIELLLDEGLALPAPYGTEFDLDVLLRMDTATMVKTLADSVGAGIESPNEARKRINRPPVPGGETPYLQQQYWPLSQLAQREIPPIPSAPTPTDDEDEPNLEREDEDDDDADTASLAAVVRRKAMEQGILHA